MEHFRLIQRIFCIDADRIEQAMRSYPNGFHDGIAIVTFNGIYSDDSRVSDMDVYRAFFARMRQNGCPVHVNYSSSVGHTDIQKTAQKPPYPTMVGEHGNTCFVSACPRSAEFAAHLHSSVTAYAALRPDVFWVDDDFRLSGHEPVVRGCFCGDCIARFNREYGLSFTRQTLVEALCADTQVDGKSVRAAWQDYNRAAMVALTELLADAIHAVDDGIVIGFMQCVSEGVMYEHPHFEALIAAAANKNGEVWFRHGSGFYDDTRPYDVIAKNLGIARLCAMTGRCRDRYKIVHLTEEVTSPYIRRTKSMTVTLLEAAMNIGVAGADGIMDEGIKPNLTEQLLPGHLVSEMHGAYRFLDALYRLRGDKVQIGIYPFHDEDLWRYNDPVSSLGQMSDLGARYYLNLFNLGLPITANREHADVLLFSGRTVRAMDRDSLRAWLSRGVYMDGTTAGEIARLLSDDHRNYIGVRSADYEEAALTGAHTSERFTDHPLNGEDAGYCRYNIWGGSRDGAACLVSDGAQVLSYSMAQAEADAGIVGTTYFENEVGGRVAVLSRGAWCPDILGAAKGRQICRIMDALAGGALPARLTAETRCGISVWKNEDDTERAVYIYNTDYDVLEHAILTTDIPFMIEQLCEDGTYVPLTDAACDRIALGTLAPWTCTAYRLRRNPDSGK